jgi:hypothetical protein
VVQERGTFDGTALGVFTAETQRTARRGPVGTCAWLARNLPFAGHAALGVEKSPYAIERYTHEVKRLDRVIEHRLAESH